MVCSWVAAGFAAGVAAGVTAGAVGDGSGAEAESGVACAASGSLLTDSGTTSGSGSTRSGRSKSGRSKSGGLLGVLAEVTTGSPVGLCGVSKLRKFWVLIVESGAEALAKLSGEELATVAAGEALSLRSAPHCPQKLAFSWTVLPQLGQAVSVGSGV